MTIHRALDYCAGRGTKTLQLATLHPDATIAGILNRQGRKTARGERFTAAEWEVVAGCDGGQC